MKEGLVHVVSSLALSSPHRTESPPIRDALQPNPEVLRVLRRSLTSSSSFQSPSFFRSFHSSSLLLYFVFLPPPFVLFSLPLFPSFLCRSIVSLLNPFLLPSLPPDVSLLYLSLHIPSLLSSLPPSLLAHPPPYSYRILQRRGNMEAAAPPGTKLIVTLTRGGIEWGQFSLGVAEGSVGR